MVAALRHAVPELEDLLHREGARFSFFQAVRLLERLHPERALVGGLAPPFKEVVRFRSHLSLAFPATEIVQPRAGSADREEPRRQYVILPARGGRPHEPTAGAAAPTERSRELRPAQMTVSFLGLTGPRGALPYHYTELLLERVLGHRDHALRDFLDLFNHRLISLFYRAWAKHRPTLSFERRALGRTTDDGKPADEWAWFLSSLIGLGTEGLKEQLSLPAHGLLAYAGPLAHRTRSAATLAHILRDALSEPQLQVVEFIGQQYELPPESQACLGEHGCELGLDTVLGDLVHLQDAKFRIRIGPLPLARYHRYLPASADGAGDGKVFRTLVEITRLFAGPALDFDIELLHEAVEKVGLCLGASGPLAPRLGMTTWLVHSERAGAKHASLFPASA